MTNHIPVARWPAITFLTFLLLVLIGFGAWTGTAGGDTLKGSVTYFGGPVHGAATHHGDRKPTFVQGSVLRLTKGRHAFIVRVNDVCQGSSCRTLDLNPVAFDALRIPRAQGVGRVTIACGRAGHKGMGKCLAGEDQ